MSYTICEAQSGKQETNFRINPRISTEDLCVKNIGVTSRKAKRQKRKFKDKEIRSSLSAG
jgi:hypothetical protein